MSKHHDGYRVLQDDLLIILFFNAMVPVRGLDFAVTPTHVWPDRRPADRCLVVISFESWPWMVTYTATVLMATDVWLSLERFIISLCKLRSIHRPCDRALRLSESLVCLVLFNSSAKQLAMRLAMIHGRILRFFFLHKKLVKFRVMTFCHPCNFSPNFLYVGIKVDGASRIRRKYSPPMNYSG